MDDEFDLTDEAGDNSPPGAEYRFLDADEIAASSTPLQGPTVGPANRTSDPADMPSAHGSSTITMADIRRRLKW